MKIIIPEELKKFKDKIIEKQEQFSKISSLDIVEFAVSHDLNLTRKLCVIRNDYNFTLQLTNDDFKNKEDIQSIIPANITVNSGDAFVFLILAYSDFKPAINYQAKYLTAITNANSMITEIENILNIVETTEFSNKTKILDDAKFSATIILDENIITEPTTEFVPLSLLNKH